MKKALLLFAAGLSLVMSVQAAPVDVRTAHRVAVTFWNSHRPLDVKPVDTMQYRAFGELSHQYVFANDTIGFVIVAADDRVRPVLGYSFDSPFPTRLHPEIRYWLGTYEEQIAYAVTLDDAPANPRWSSLMAGDVPPVPVSLQDIAALCKTRWDQGAPYNYDCPYDTIYNERSVVGCVATAMAQIMKRWNHPSSGTGSHSYEHTGRNDAAAYGILEADFEHTTYMWEYMPVRMGASTPNEKTRALSKLCYHCGVAVDMMYSPQASGAYSTCGWWSDACAVSAFRDYFKYDPDLEFRQRNDFDSNTFISDSVWLAMIDEELANGRPLYYSGSDYTGGHAFVLDGSDLDTCYHFNWGWDGYADGFYAMSNLAPGAGGYGGNATYTFNLDQGAIFGIQPVLEDFDTVDMYDTICSNYERYNYEEYIFPAAACDTFMRHLDTVFRLHLEVVTSHTLTYHANYGGFSAATNSSQYCRYDPVVFPECEFTRSGFLFEGWSRGRNRASNEPIYQPGDTIFISGNVTFYARWRDSNAVAIADVDDDGIALWPNPATDKVTIDFGQPVSASVVIFDMLGRSVLSVNHTNGDTPRVEIPLEGLREGAYTVQIRTSKGLYNRRIIKQ